MTEKEAIEILEEEKEYHGEGTLIEAFDMAIEALKKQMPQKANCILRHRGGFETMHCPNCDKNYQVDNRYDIKEDYCPNCCKWLDSSFKNYCGNCGKRIDWGDEK